MAGISRSAAKRAGFGRFRPRNERSEGGRGAVWEFSILPAHGTSSRRDAAVHVGEPSLYPPPSGPPGLPAYLRWRRDASRRRLWCGGGTMGQEA